MGNEYYLEEYLIELLEEYKIFSSTSFHNFIEDKYVDDPIMIQFLTVIGNYLNLSKVVSVIMNNTFKYFIYVGNMYVVDHAIKTAEVYYEPESN